VQSAQTQSGYCEEVSTEDRRKIDAQLERMLVHPLFRQSKRLPAFLRFVVQESLLHGTDGPPKERTLGIAVFGRRPDYDTATDPVVRVTATELRKKLAQYYYEEGHFDEIRIERPPGSYLPKFRKSAANVDSDAREAEDLQQRLESSAGLHAGTVEANLAAADHAAIELQPRQAEISVASDALLPGESRNEVGHGAAKIAAPLPDGSASSFWRIASFILAAMLVATLGGYIPLSGVSHHSSLTRFWSSFVGKSPQVLIVMPVITHGENVDAKPSDVSVAGNLSIEDTNIAARVAARLEMLNSPYRLVSAPELNFGDLRGVPAVLIGALDNVWTMRRGKTLPFAFEESPDGRTGRIVDTQDPGHRSWSIDITTPHTHITKDYGIVARYRDTMTGEPVLILAGISSQGTQAAGEAVTNPEYIDVVLGSAMKASSNFEVIVETEAIDGRSGPPRVVASRTW
jgi:hypothetical protein